MHRRAGRHIEQALATTWHHPYGVVDVVVTTIVFRRCLTAAVVGHVFLSMSARPLLIIFAKAPVEGEVNTRLIPELGVATATALQQEMIELRMRQFGAVESFDVCLFCAPDTDHSCFQSCARQHGIALHTQQGEDLGVRMADAMNRMLARYPQVAIIGTDAPLVDEQVVTEAFAQLQDHDVVIKPAEDGGYVLIAMRKFNPVIFQTVSWGSERVLVKTRANIVAAGLTWQELDVTWDIDNIEDYRRYRRLQQQSAEEEQ